VTLTTIKELDSVKILNYLIITYAFFIPISRAGIGITSALIILVWLLKFDIKNDIKQFLQNKFTLIFLLLILYTFISLLWSSNIDEGINYAKRYWYYFPLFIIALHFRKEYFKPAISAFLLSMFVSEMMSYGMYFELISWTNSSSPYATPFMNHLQYSAYVVFTSLFLLNQILYEKDMKMKLFYSIFFLSVSINLFVNGGRIGYVAFFSTIFIVFILHMQNKIKALIISILIIVFSVSVAYNASAIFKKRVDFTLKELNYIAEEKFHTSFGQRLAMFYMGGQILKENPLIGVGAGDEMDVLKEKIKTEEYKKFHYLDDRRHFHNVFLHITVQLGLLGLILILALFYYFYKIPIKDTYYSNIKYIFITVYLITCLTGNMFHQQFTMALLTLFGGLILNQSLLESKAEKL